MRLVIQRVLNAEVRIRGDIFSKINNGLLILIGVEVNDNQEDVKWLIQKTLNLRIFSDNKNKMNLSIKDINGEVLAISQFTLHAKVKKGNRPSFMNSANPELAQSYYTKFIDGISKDLETEVKAGVFGADMKVSLTNDGPVTIIIDSKNRE
jgi:D-tyrosyl-tRNA(Tyr) deacylase